MYCRRSVAHLTPSALRRELSDADLYTLAEALNLPEGEEAAVRAMKPHLRVVGDEAGPNPPAGGINAATFDYAEVHYKPEGRPIQIERVTGAPAKETVQETLNEVLPPAKTVGARRVRAHLEDTVELVEFELGIPDSLHLGATLTEVLAFFVAAEGDGLVWFYGRDWASPSNRGKTLWKTE